MLIFLGIGSNHGCEGGNMNLKKFFGGLIVFYVCNTLEVQASSIVSDLGAIRYSSNEITHDGSYQYAYDLTHQNYIRYKIDVKVPVCIKKAHIKNLLDIRAKAGLGVAQRLFSEYSRGKVNKHGIPPCFLAEGVFIVIKKYHDTGAVFNHDSFKTIIIKIVFVGYKEEYYTTGYEDMQMYKEGRSPLKTKLI